MTTTRRQAEIEALARLEGYTEAERIGERALAAIRAARLDRLERVAHELHARLEKWLQRPAPLKVGEQLTRLELVRDQLGAVLDADPGEIVAGRELGRAAWRRIAEGAACEEKPAIGSRGWIEQLEGRVAALESAGFEDSIEALGVRGDQLGDRLEVLEGLVKVSRRRLDGADAALRRLERAHAGAHGAQHLAAAEDTPETGNSVPGDAEAPEAGEMLRLFRHLARLGQVARNGIAEATAAAEHRRLEAAAEAAGEAPACEGAPGGGKTAPRGAETLEAALALEGDCAAPAAAELRATIDAMRAEGFEVEARVASASLEPGDERLEAMRRQREADERSREAWARAQDSRDALDADG